MAAMAGLLGNARATAVPTVTLWVPRQASAAGMKAVLAVSANHTLSNPASSALRANVSIRPSSPPTTMPTSTSVVELVLVLRGGAKPLRDDLQHVERDGGVLLHEPPEGPGGETEQGDRRGGGDGSRSRASIEQGDLAEEVSRAQPGPDLPTDAHVGRALGDQEEPDAGVSLAGD